VALISVDVRIVDTPLARGEDEKDYVITEILWCEITLGGVPEPLNGPERLRVTEQRHNMRHASLRSWLLAELELLKYGQSHFSPFDLEPSINIIRIAIAIYDDDFNAYRGVYHGIGGIYLGILNLSKEQRNTLRNIHPIMFIPHAAERGNIYTALEAELRELETDGIRLQIRDQEFLVYVKLLLQITDMPQGSRP
jgi:hypothetical protein